MENDQRKSLKSDLLVSPLAVKTRSRNEVNALRKENREKVFSARRFCKSSSSSISTDIPDYTTANVKLVAKDIQKKTANIVDQLKYLRTAFSYTSDFVAAFLEVGNSLHALVGYLTGKNSTLQLEASWCITNLSANYDNSNIMQVVKATAPYLITYLQSGSELIQDQSALALGNMAADSDEVRELLFQQGILYPLMELSKTSNVSIAQSAIFALSSMTKSQELVVPIIMSSDLPSCFVDVLQNHKSDIYLVSELAWLMTYLTCDEKNIGLFMEKDALKDMLHWLVTVRPHQKEFHFVVTPFIRCLGNIIGSDNVWIDINGIISTENVLLSLNNFLLTNKRYLIKECLWLLANIFARRELSITDNLKEIQVIISNVKRHLNSAYEIKKESVVCLHNMALHEEIIKDIFDEEALTSLIKILKLPDVEIIYLTLKCIEIAFMPNNKVVLDLFMTLDGPSYLEALSYNENEDVRTLSACLLEKYENEKEEEGDS